MTAKRSVDILGILILSPIIVCALLIIGAFVFVNLGRPIFFCQERVGRDKKIFVVYKFRSLAPLTENAGTSSGDEERASAFGMFLRDYGLDEIPQIFNILKGDMTLIGPRPLLPETVEGLDPRYDALCSMKPGLLSLPVIRGRRSIPMSERLDINLEYVRNYSLLLDLKILLGSFFVVMGRRAARD